MNSLIEWTILPMFSYSFDSKISSFDSNWDANTHLQEIGQGTKQPCQYKHLGGFKAKSYGDYLYVYVQDIFTGLAQMRTHQAYST